MVGFKISVRLLTVGFQIYQGELTVEFHTYINVEYDKWDFCLHQIRLLFFFFSFINRVSFILDSQIFIKLSHIYTDQSQVKKMQVTDESDSL